MTLRNQVLIWVAMFAVAVLVLWVFRGILLPFVVGLALAYLLNPVVGALERLRFSRGWATAVVLLVVISVIAGLLFVFVPLVIQQVIGLAQRLPSYITQLRALSNEWLPAFNEWLGPERALQLENTINDFIANLPALTATVTAQIAASSASIINTVAFVVLAPVIAFYLLLDWQAMNRGLDELLPRDHRPEIQGIIAEIDRSMSGVIRGQGGVVLILTFYYATALSLTGLNFGLAIGLIAGLLSFVPFVGFLTGFVLSVGVALVQFWPNWVMVTIVLAIFLIGQFLEGNVLYPKLVGSSININPVWLMFALFAFGLLFGFVGLLLAVPLSAIAGVLTRFAIRKYKESSLYKGQQSVPPADRAAV
jgi:predicted PurR-regulated permease PerM